MDELESLYDATHPKEKGYWYVADVIKESAKGTIDNITKFAYSTEDYETKTLWHEYTEEELEQRRILEEQAAKRQKEQEFLDDGPEDVENLKMNQEDIILAMADMIGGSF